MPPDSADVVRSVVGRVTYCCKSLLTDDDLQEVFHVFLKVS